LKPQKRVPPLSRRPDSALAFVGVAAAAGPPLLLDTTVYIDELQGRLPAQAEALLKTRQLRHSNIAVSELAHLFGRLDPAHPKTTATLDKIGRVIEAIPPHRLSTPSGRAMVDAGIIAGAIARLRNLPAGGHRRFLNDSMLLAQALEEGCWLMSRNIADMDLIQQLMAAGRVLLYRQTP
jgi:predicted nucleic acid-binding protein